MSGALDGTVCILEHPRHSAFARPSVTWRGNMEIRAQDQSDGVDACCAMGRPLQSAMRPEASIDDGNSAALQRIFHTSLQIA